MFDLDRHTNQAAAEQFQFFKSLVEKVFKFRQILVEVFEGKSPITYRDSVTRLTKARKYFHGRSEGSRFLPEHIVLVPFIVVFLFVLILKNHVLVVLYYIISYLAIEK
jgi:hypothetical protein